MTYPFFQILKKKINLIIGQEVISTTGQHSSLNFWFLYHTCNFLKMKSVTLSKLFNFFFWYSPAKHRQESFWSSNFRINSYITFQFSDIHFTAELTVENYSLLQSTTFIWDERLIVTQGAREKYFYISCPFLSFFKRKIKTLQGPLFTILANFSIIVIDQLIQNCYFSFFLDNQRSYLL